MGTRKYVKGPDGKLAGSIGSGKDTVPTPASVSSVSSEGTATVALPLNSSADAWAKYQQAQRDKPAVPVRLSARDWQIFSSEPGADQVADSLNKAADHALSLPTVEEANAYWEGCASEFQYSHGALDTEPRGEFAELALKVYGDKARDYYGFL